MSAAQTALENLMANKGKDFRKKHTLELDGVASTQLLFLSEMLSNKEATVASELLASAINEAYEQLGNYGEYSLPDDDTFDEKLEKVIGKKKKVVKKAATQTEQVTTA